MPLKQPILPTRILRNTNYVAIVILAAVGQMAFFCMSILWPQQIAALYSTDNATIGWMSVSCALVFDIIIIVFVDRILCDDQCTSGLALAIGEIIQGPLLKPLGRSRYQLILSAVAMTTFSGAMAATTQHTKGMAIAVSEVFLHLPYISLLTFFSSQS